MKLRFLVWVIFSITLSTILTQEASAQDTIRVGIILPLSGEYAHFGQGVLRGIELADATPGGKKLQLFIEDNSTCAAMDAVLAFKKLTEIDKIDIAVTFCTGASKGILPLAKAQKLPLIQLTEPGTQDDTYMVKMMPPSFSWNDLLAEAHATKYSKIAVVANIMEVNTGEHGNVSTFTKRFESTGGKVVFSENFPDDATDFRTLIIKLKESGAQAICPFIWNAKQLATFMKQADELKLWSKVTLAGNFVFEILYNDLLPLYPKIASLNGILSANFAKTTSSEFSKQFSDRYGENPPQFADYGYDSISMLKRCGTTIDCLTAPFEGASGAVSFDPTRRRVGVNVLRVLLNGTFIDLKTTREESAP